MLSWLLGTPQERAFRREWREQERVNQLTQDSFKRYIASRREFHEEARRREAAWRAAGRPVWRVSADNLTEERVYLDAEDAIKAMGAE